MYIFKNLENGKIISGLFGISIILILSTYFPFSFTKGGWIGVDIFLVTIGFIISKEIFYAKTNFLFFKFIKEKLIVFYPEIFLVSLFSTFIIFKMVPLEINFFIKIIISNLSLLSNFFYWNSPSSMLNPLGHLWLISLLFQFYIIFGIMFLLSKNLDKSFSFIILSVIFIFSLGLSHYGSVFGRGLATHLLFPFRIWEVIAGVFTGMILQNKHLFRHLLLFKSYKFIGLILIFGSYFFFDNRTPTPSLYTLVPVLGTMFILISQNNVKYFLDFFLENKIFIFFGNLIASIYIFTFAFIIIYQKFNLITLTAVNILMLIMFSIFFSYVFMKFKNFIFNFSKKFIIIVFVYIAMISINLNQKILEKFVDFRFSDQQINLINKIEQSTNYNFYLNMINKNCHIFSLNMNNKMSDKIEDCYNMYGSGILIIGDSHAMNLHNIISKLPDNPFIITFADGGCRFKSLNYKGCFYGQIDNFINHNKNKLKYIIYHQGGSKLLKDKYENIGTKLIFDTENYSVNRERINIIIANIKDLEKKTEKKIIWLGPFKEYVYHPYNIVFWRDTLKIHKNSTKIFNLLEKEIVDQTKTEKFENYLSFDQLFKIPERVIINDCVVWKDASHLSNCGEEILSDSILGKL